MVKDYEYCHDHLIITENTRGADYVCGDIHGCYTELKQALKQIGFEPEHDRLIALGDIVDRGPHGLACLGLLKEPWFYSIVGNHEHMMCDYVFHKKLEFFWRTNGGQWYFDLSQAGRDQVKELCMKHVRKLPHSITMKLSNGLRVGFCHADPPENWNTLKDDEVDLKSLMWGRTRIANKNTCPVENIDMVLVGHTPDFEIRKLGNVVNIDTGSGYDIGTLTLFEISPFVNRKLKEQRLKASGEAQE